MWAGVRFRREFGRFPGEFSGDELTFGVDSLIDKMTRFVLGYIDGIMIGKGRQTIARVGQISE